MSRHSRILAGLALAGLVVTSSAAHATPSALFTWLFGGPLSCGQPVNDGWLEDHVSWTLDVAVTDLVEPYQAYAATIEIVPQDGLAFPDAWRFDGAGCQAAVWDGFRYDPSPSESGCGSLVYGEGATIQSSSAVRTFDPQANRLRLDLALALEGPHQLAFPAAPYLVFRIPFNHAHSVLTLDTAPGNCGGRERPVCVWLRSLRFQRADGSWYETARPLPVIAVNTPSVGGPSACASVPTRASTWGALKGSYR